LFFLITGELPIIYDPDSSYADKLQGIARREYNDIEVLLSAKKSGLVKTISNGLQTGMENIDATVMLKSALSETAQEGVLL